MLLKTLGLIIIPVLYVVILIKIELIPSFLTYRGFAEVQLVHEVLRRNRGYLEMTIPMNVIITTLEAQDVLLPYELHQVKSHASLIEKNRSFLGSLMRKSPDMFYTFCSIMEGLPGYEYIGRYLRAEMKDVDPTVLSFDEKVECLFTCTFGVDSIQCVMFVW